MKLSEKFIENCKKKFLENILSIKVWIIFSLLAISTIMVYTGQLSGDVWATVNGGVISTVCAVREAFKVAKIKANGAGKDVMP